MKTDESGRRIIVIGELNVDIVITGLSGPPIFGQEILATGFEMTLGSASAIFACGMATLGHAVTFIGQVGDDEMGTFCLGALGAAGISTERVREDPQLKTGMTVAFSTQEDRALVTILGAISELRIEQVDLTALAGHDHLHLTSYFLQHGLRPHFPQIFQAARSYGLTTSFDPNSDPAAEWDESIWDVIRATDILFVNEIEALQLTRRRSVDEALAHLAELVPCAVIKLGGRGAIATRAGESESVPGFKVAAIDTTGAGDSFAAGFLHAFLNAADLRTCLIYGNSCGALSTLKAGGTCNQPTVDRLNEFLRGNEQ
ncbi:MAG: sugar kinase [Acidobacteriota bacterium]